MCPEEDGEEDDEDDNCDGEHRRMWKREKEALGISVSIYTAQISD